MKRSKCLVLLVSLVLVAMVLPSCGKTIKTASSFERALNPDYKVEDAVWNEIVEVPELEGFSFFHVYDEHAIWFEREENKGKTYALYNVLEQEMVLTFYFRENLCEIELLCNGLFQVTERTPEKHIDHIGPQGSWSEDFPSELVCVTMYDAMGKELASRTAEEPQIEYDALTERMVVVDGVLYELDDATGAYSESENIPVYNLLSDSVSLSAQGEYFYCEDDAQMIHVFDKAWNALSVWGAPSYAENFKWFVLNNGNVLIQYRYQLDDDEKSYDFYEPNKGNTAKFAMVTLLMNAENGKVKTLDLPYYIEEAYSYEHLTMDQKDNPVYGNDVENIAYVYPIVDHRIDFSDAAKDVILMSNKGKIQKSLKLLDAQMAEIPKKVGDDLYRVPLLTGGVAIVTIDGELVRSVNNTEFVIWENDFYCVSKNGVVYTSAFEEVYDWTEIWRQSLEDMRVVSLGSSLFIWTPEEVLQLRGTEIKTLLTFGDGVDEYDFDVLSGIGYRIRENDTYINYNEDGTELLQSDGSLYSILKYSKDSRVCLCISGQKYYILTR